MWKVLALAATLLTGCHAELGDDPGGSAGVDANGGGGGGGGSDAGGGGSQPDAPRACANGRVVYLAFEGVTLTKAAASDATQNRASWMSNTSGTVPPYHAGQSDRATQIQTIVAGVKARLAGTPIEVVTQRPATGPYVMVVLGGANTDVGTPYTYATNEHDCGDGVKSDVGWISDLPTVSYVQDLVVGTVGWGLGLNGTNDPVDCMCAWANTCESAAGACTLSSSIASTTSLSPATTCPNQNPQNEVAAFSTGFCQ
jgi:hypothetical protein